MKILYVGDVYSKLGRETLKRNLDFLRSQNQYDLILVNGENATHGKGLSDKHYEELMSYGAHCILLGNHSFQNPAVLNVFARENKLIRPYNMAPNTPGTGYKILNVHNVCVCVAQLSCQVFMMENTYTNPFTEADKLLEEISCYNPKVIFIDIHGEATSEKIALGYYLDGRISALCGTHTHVQTNDARVLSQGTAYISDVGMTGALNGVIGTERNIIINRFVYGQKAHFAPQEEGPTQFNAVEIDIDEQTGLALNIKPYHIIEG